MTTSRQLIPGTPAFSELTERLRVLCQNMDHGLLSRDEFEEQLDELEWRMIPQYCLEERQASAGRRSFLVRHRQTGATVKRFTLVEE